VSHALARLRTALQDELFVHAPTGLVPTQRAASRCRSTPRMRSRAATSI